MQNDVPISDVKGHRTLATVVFTDCVSFSARMSENEDHTLDLIRRDMKLMKRVCEQYEGRVLKSTGDGLLMYFASAVKAVECAIEIQRTVTEASAQRSPEDILQHRIGIHLADMFITETDVMGNGVNIAARLQALADPGGICLSQTVYDVVKVGLQVGIQSLGLRELKNIREEVPVYKVLLQPEEEPTDPQMAAIAHLSRHRDLNRIKKLLFYVCKNIWESQPNKLDALELSDLIQELLRLAPSEERLKQALNSAVQSLSKSAEYTLVANEIITEFSKLYLHLAAAVVPDGDNQAQSHLPYETVAGEIEQADGSGRMKKLLFYICRSRWESDPLQLDAVRTSDLLMDLYRLAPSLDQVRATCDRFVQTLSKRDEYSLVGNALISKLMRIYDAAGKVPKAAQQKKKNNDDTHLETRPFTDFPELEQVAHLKPYQAIALNLEQISDVFRIKKLILYVCRRQWESDPMRLRNFSLAPLLQELHQIATSFEQLTGALNSVVRTLNKPAEYAAIAEAIATAMHHLYPDPLPLQPHPVKTNPAIATVAPAEIPPLETPTPDADSTPIPISTETLPVQPATDPEPAHAEITPAAAPAASPATSPIDLFDYRLEIMKYTNPLRTKILLFSALNYDFGFTSQDWLNLKMQALDDLLRRLLTTCKAYTDMEALLYAAARRLAGAEENVETVTSVIQCLRPFYLYGDRTAVLERSGEETCVSLDEQPLTMLNLPEVEQEEDFTCQLLTVAAEMSPVVGSPPILPEQCPHKTPDKTVAIATTITTESPDHAQPAENSPPIHPALHEGATD